MIFIVLFDRSRTNISWKVNWAKRRYRITRTQSAVTVTTLKTNNKIKLTKGRLACLVIIEDWMIPSAVRRYWRLNYPFWCVLHSKNSQGFSMSRITHKIFPFRQVSCGRSILSNAWFLGPMQIISSYQISIGSAVFAGLTNVTSRQIDTQTTIHRL